MKNEQKLRHLKVSGMTCRACEEKIERSLRQIEGIVKVRADRHKTLGTYSWGQGHVVRDRDTWCGTGTSQRFPQKNHRQKF
ncbi:heavy-metal-associated domain-containing protein [Acidaminobacter hydrogenoformans]|uniref:Heavy-metal-associated domain-containing protein n=1 Tax=Acidaminobacter hydrogenoformans DSM 2784 TaxID=1120920 RepID=A0A1G5S3F0_9FIRM|nr:heavy metal-associated domain-containing protein [Acidaminobacter hydrogenoformans]SCZ80895.1 Heavy-metal-associated domain-containing protein [Acidaminobacter hydrogenoformans DSM 2784]